MPTVIYGSDRYGDGDDAPPDLADGVNVFVKANVVIGSTTSTGLTASGSFHTGMIYGAIIGDLNGVAWGNSYTNDSNNRLYVRAGGSITGLVSTGVYLVGYASTINNAGDIYGGLNGINVQGDVDALRMSIINSGYIEGGNIGISHSGVVSLNLMNTGLIKGSAWSLYSSASFSASGIDNITNNGMMVGNIYLGGGADTYDGRLGHVQGQIFGGDGNDIIYGGTEDNSIFGGAGGDRMAGGAGSDDYFVEEVGDSVIEALDSGTDTVSSTISYTLGSNVENLTLLGSADVNGTGNAFANTLIGNSGANILNGGAGADAMQGALGSDSYYVDNAADIVFEAANAGIDIVYTTVSYALAANVENIQANAGALTITGNALGNRLYDFAQNGTSMAGGAESDYYYVRNAKSTISELATAGSGMDRVYAFTDFDLSVRAANVEMLYASAANLKLTGNELANVIAGSTGAETLNGKLGSDVLTGRPGADTFVFDTALGATNIDTITDFSHADDTIQLSKTIFAALTGSASSPLSDAQFQAIESGDSYDANARIIYEFDTGRLFYDAAGSGGTGPMVQIALLSTKPQDLAANDFLLSV